jgi:transposase
MSLQMNWNREIPSDTAQVGQAILGPNNSYRLIGDGVNDFLCLEDFSDLYSKLGRGAICPIILSLITVFQFLENIPDRVAAQWAVARIDWKYALHMPLTWLGFHFSDLSNFRQRLLEHSAERLVFERVLTWIQTLGFLKKHGRQRSDSTHVLARVERMSRLEMAWETLRVALRAIRETAPRWYAQVVPAAFHEAYAERQSDWRLSQEEVRRAMQRAGQDGFWLLHHLDDSAPEEVLSLSEVAIVRQVWAQQFECREGKTIVRRPPIKGRDVITSPHEPEARWSKKHGREWVGYKLHVTETVPEDEDDDDAEGGADDSPVQFITDIGLSAANEPDHETLGGIQAQLRGRGLSPQEHYVDKGYVTGLNLAASRQRGIDLVGAALVRQGTKQVGYRQVDFALDFAAQQAICPAGQASSSWRAYPAPEASYDAERREIKVGFGRACRHCPLRGPCNPGRNGRSLTISAFYPELTARRAEQETAAFKERLHRRAGVEGTIFGLTWCHGARRARYRGQCKVRLQALFIGAAANLKRLARAVSAQQQRPNRATAETGASG